MNKNALWIIGIIIGVIVLLGIAGISTYNGLIGSDESVKQAWADVESSYQRRMDLIPNLVATVQGSADFESSTLTQITELRSQAVSAQQSFTQATSPSQQIAAAGEAESVLSRLLVIVESYPDISSTQNFADLQVQLEGTENRISVARDRYNGAVKTFNTKVRSFPSNIIAGMAGLSTATPFEAAAGAQVPPKVVFK